MVQVTVPEKLAAVKSCVALNGTVVELALTVGVPDDVTGVGVGIAVAVELPPPPQPIAIANIAQPRRTPKILDILPNPFVVRKTSPHK
jgi:hypothetical protein